MAIFIDAFYPGNSKRSNRLAELTSDCQNLFADASVHKEQVENIKQYLTDICRPF